MPDRGGILVTMKATWRSLSAWAYALDGRRRWQLWFVLAALGATLLTLLPSPWSWVTTLPIALIGFVLFDAQARRDRDEAGQRVDPRP